MCYKTTIIQGGLGFWVEQPSDWRCLSVFMSLQKYKAYSSSRPVSHGTLGQFSHILEHARSVISYILVYSRLALVWQDALLALAFDRPPTSRELDLISDLPELAVAASCENALDYRQAMNWLCHMTLRHFSPSNEQFVTESRSQLFQDFQAFDSSLTPHLRDRQHCSSIQTLQEFYSLELHRNFLLSTVCRPVLSSEIQQKISIQEYGLILEQLQDGLKRSVHSFIKLRSISRHSTRSWAYIHNGLSSALLLSFMKETSRTDDTRQIQTRLVQVLTEQSEDMGEFSITHRKALRALKTLQRLTEQDSEGQRTAFPSNGPPFTSFPEGVAIPDEFFSNSDEQR